jgi:hypothetical protein
MRGVPEPKGARHVGGLGGAATVSGAKHTPGPWQVSRDNDTTLTIVAPWSDKVRTGAEGWGDYRGIHTASITHHSGYGAVPREHAEANAALIAAAPELLEALQLIVTWNRDHARDQYGDPEKAESWACVRAARAAILKATGSTAC